MKLAMLHIPHLKRDLETFLQGHWVKCHWVKDGVWQANQWSNSVTLNLKVSLTSHVCNLSWLVNTHRPKLCAALQNSCDEKIIKYFIFEPIHIKEED